MKTNNLYPGFFPNPHLTHIGDTVTSNKPQDKLLVYQFNIKDDGLRELEKNISIDQGFKFPEQSNQGDTECGYLNFTKYNPKDFWGQDHQNNESILIEQALSSNNQLSIYKIHNGRFYLNHKHVEGNVLYSSLTDNISGDYKNIINDSTIHSMFTRYQIDFLSFYNNNTISSNLTPREKSIIFFILLGKTQDEIASIFNVSRSYICKLIFEDISYKIINENCSMRLLKEKLINLGFQHYIPPHLFDKCAASFAQPKLNYRICDTLNETQYTILQLLCANLTQEEIGKRLKYSRSMVSKIISQELFKLFGIKDCSTKSLLNTVAAF